MTGCDFVMPVRYTRKYIDNIIDEGQTAANRATGLIIKNDLDKKDSLFDRFEEAKMNYCLVHSNVPHAHSSKLWGEIVNAQSNIYAYAMICKEYANCLGDDNGR